MCVIVLSLLVLCFVVVTRFFNLFLVFHYFRLTVLFSFSLFFHVIVILYIMVTIITIVITIIIISHQQIKTAITTAKQ